MSNQDKQLTVLIPEAGGDAGLSAFKSLVYEHGMNIRIIATDADPKAPSISIKKFIHVPYATDEERYMEAMKRIMEKYEPSLIMPTSDFDAKVLSRNKLELAQYGCIPVVSDEEVINAWEDKLCMAETHPSIHPVTSLHPDNVPGEYIFAKPRYGVGSRGIIVLHREEALYHYEFHKEEYIYQELLEGEQYTVDVLCSLDGQPLQAVTRRVYRLKGGVDTVCAIVHSPKMEHIAMELCRNYSVVGAACFEFMFDKQGEPLLIDCQPRLSGAHIVTTIAGLNIPAQLIELSKGNEFTPKPVNYNVKVVRTFNEEVVSW